MKSLYLGNLIVIEEVEGENEAKDVDILFPEPTLVVHSSKPSQVWQEEDARAGALGRKMNLLAENVLSGRSPGLLTPLSVKRTDLLAENI